MTVLNEADAVYLGGQAVDAVYAGANKVWPAAPPVLTYPETVLAKNPIAYWRMGLATPGPVPDQVGNARPLNLTGSMSVAASLLPNGDGASTLFTGGTASTPNVTAQMLAISSALTFEIWIKPASLPGNSTQLVNTTQPILVVLASGQVVLALAWTGASPKVQSTVNVQVGQTYHIVATSTDNTTSNLYINGQDATGTVTAQTITAANRQLVTGSGGQTALNAQMQELAYYDRPLSLTEAQENYAAGGGT